VEKIFDFANQISTNYLSFQEKSLANRRFKHTDIKALISNPEINKFFEIKLSGHSTEGREIYLLRAGQGKTKILIWTQMHGDEPTATAAIFDIFNFLMLKTQFQSEIKTILENLDLYFIPMVNPDGAQVYKRRNYLDIDLNRDAARLEAVETQLLKKLRDDIKPDYGFNLHDQETYYTVGLTKYPACISFLAPSFNAAKDVDKSRMKSIQQIVLMNKVLQKYIPNCVGRYSDDFMPTAFGDNMQFWGTSTILIESGGYYNDKEKQTARKMNFLSILSSLYAIATQTTVENDTKKYFEIPENKKDKLHDLIIRNAIIKNKGREFMMDIAIRNKEINAPDFCSYKIKAEIADLGDLTYFYGYSEFDAKGLYVADKELNEIDVLRLGMDADFCLVNSANKIIYKVENGLIIE